MSTTARKPPARRTRAAANKGNGRPRLNREQAAQRLLDILTEEPQSAASLRRQILGEDVGDKQGDVITGGLRVLASRQRAKEIPRKGWVLFQSPHEAATIEPQVIKWPFQPKMIKLSEMFVDASYQRPLTSFATDIRNNFDPFLWGSLALSDRGASAKPRYAIMDGQTRWAAASELGVTEGPSNVYTNLTPEQEADLFERFQSQRKGVLSWFRFRAALRAKKKEAIAIKRLVESVGFKIGIDEGQIRAVAALERTYRIDSYQLERTLAAIKDAWPEVVPEDSLIRGMHMFFREFPMEEGRRGKKQKHEEIDDERLVRRLKTTNPALLATKAQGAKASSLTGKGSKAKFMAQAIQNAYRTGK